jgi:DNA (cytosine-5)-methyltransferase 1
MGQGRYVHPTQKRLITPHEAARLQFIPDFFDFSAAPGRTALAEMIGNAVPSKLAYVIGVELLR